MSRYEDGLPPVNLTRKHNEQEQKVKHEESTREIKFELKIPEDVLEECKRVIGRKHRTISKLIISKYIVQSMMLGVQVADLLSTPGTTIFFRNPDGSEEPIRFVLP